MVELFLVFLVGLIAAFIGSMVGGGGLISVPALIFLGLPPQVAIATNKVGALGGVSISSFVYYKKGVLDRKIAIPVALVSFIGAYFGAQTLLLISNAILEKAVAVIILLILLLTITNKKQGVNRVEHLSPLKTYIGYTLFLLIGFWGALFGGGFAIFAIYALLTFFGKTYIQSAAIMNFLAIAIGIMATSVYTVNKVINWPWGIALLVGMTAGGYLGSHYGIKKGNRWVRMLFITIIIASAIKLLV